MCYNDRRKGVEEMYLNLSKYEQFLEAIKYLDEAQRRYDENIDSLTSEEIEDEYKKLKKIIFYDIDLNDEAKKTLYLIIDERIALIPEIKNIVSQEYNIEKSNAIEQAKMRYSKLSYLKKLKEILSGNTPQKVNFKELSLSLIDNLYNRKRK